MKKLLVLISILLVFVFSSCEKIFDDTNPGKDFDKYAHFYLAIRIDNNDRASLSYNVIGEPPTGIKNVYLGFVENHSSDDILDFKLPLDTYEGKTVLVQLFRGNNYSEAVHRTQKEVLVKKDDRESMVYLVIDGGGIQ